MARCTYLTRLRPWHRLTSTHRSCKCWCAGVSRKHLQSFACPALSLSAQAEVSVWYVISSVGGNRRRRVACSHDTSSHPAMPTVPSIVIPLFGIFSIRLLLALRRVAHDVGSVCSRPRNGHSFNLLTTFCSNLSGPFFLFSPLSVVGYLAAQMVGHIPFVLRGSTRSLGKKHEGTSARQRCMMHA